MKGMVILRDGYIHVEHEHVSEAADIIDRIDETASLIKSGAAPRVFIDARYFHRAWPVDDAELILAAIEEKLPRNLRIAFLFPDTIPLPSRPVYQGLNETGRTARSFAQENAALAWLRSDDPHA